MKNLLTITILYLLLTMSQAWSLPPCEGNVWNNCYGIWTFDDGGKYVGEWKDSKQNGKGTSTNTAGFKYVGEHKDGKIHGQGTLFFPDGRVWDGQFSNGGEWAGGEQYATGEVPPDVLAKSGALGVMVNTVTDDIAISSDLEKTMGALVIQITPGSPAEKSGMQAGDIIIKYGEKEIDEYLTLIKIISEIDKYKSTQVEVWRNGGPTILQIVLIPTEEDSPYVIAETAQTESRVKNNNNKQTCSGSPQTDGFLKNWNNCWGTYISTVDQALGNGQKNAYMASDSKQEGEWQNNMPNGQGTATWANGDKYVGEFKDDTQNGQGTYTYASGDKYVGEYKDGKWHGQGTATWADGEKYVGEFKDGSKTGQGTYTYADGEVWQGQWKNDVWVSGKKYAAGEYNPAAAEGKSGSDTCLDNEIWDNCVGSYTDENGHSYTGEWKNNFPHGKGTYAYANGAKYVGEVKDGKMDGQGTLTYREADGGKYVGQFKVSTKYTSAKYVGELKDAYTEADGGKYVGEFKDDELNGQGTMFFADGRLWFGQFSDGRWVEGQKFAAGAGDSVIDLIKAGTDVCLKTDEVWENCVASRTEEDGNIYTGEWKNNKHDGKGTYSLKDGRKYVGEFKDGKKDGQGTFTWTGKWSGQKYVGEWKDNNYHGQGTMTYISGDKYLESGKITRGMVREPTHFLMVTNM